MTRWHCNVVAFRALLPSTVWLVPTLEGKSLSRRESETSVSKRIKSVNTRLNSARTSVIPSAYHDWLAPRGKYGSGPAACACDSQLIFRSPLVLTSFSFSLVQSQQPLPSRSPYSSPVFSNQYQVKYRRRIHIGPMVVAGL